MAKKGMEYLESSEKRALDIASGVAAASVLLPAAVVVGAVAAVDTGTANPLFSQARVGGKLSATFKAWKLRTLPAGEQPPVVQTFGTFDPRASKVGMFIRQTGLDEIPQLLNVLGGNMSMVGTRPLPISDIDRNQAAAPHLFDDWYAYFQAVKPGITGESQIFRHHYRHMTRDIIERSMQMDLDYFESASLRQDMRWLARTPLRMIAANLHVVEELAENPIIAQASEAPLV